MSADSAAYAAHYSGMRVRAISPNVYFSSYLENGGSNDMTVNGSSTTVAFTVAPSAGNDLVIGRLIMYMEEGTAFDSTKFGGLTALTNGVQIACGGVELANIKDNIDWLSISYDTEDAGAAFGKAGKTLHTRWTFHRAVGGSFSGLRVANGETFAANVRDNLTGLDVFRILVQGVEISTAEKL